MNITFHGAAQTVTGSKHLVKTPLGNSILLDCGLFQGEGVNNDELNYNFGFDPISISCLVLSHAHIDHTGLIPRLVKLGFKGKIYCNQATMDLCQFMLEDSAHIQESDIERVNKRRLAKNIAPIQPLYTLQDVKNTLPLFNPINSETWVKITDDTQVFLTPMGHIIGSSAISLKMNNGQSETILTFTGDIGRDSDKLLKGPFRLPNSHYLITESTYGNKLHPPLPNVEEEFLNLIQQICGKQGGKLIIPAFSVDRTQELIYLIDRMAYENKLPKLKVFVDSPLSIKATNVMRNHNMDFNPEVLEHIARDGDPFGFDYLYYISSVEDSKNINNLKEPCIIISASGMATAGRIKHHIANNINNSNNAILLVGYASPFSLAGKLKNGDKSVRIFGDEYPVKASVHTMDYFSGHADYNEMLSLLNQLDKSMIKQTFLVHGEIETMDDWKLTLEQNNFTNVTIPIKGESFKLK